MSLADRLKKFDAHSSVAKEFRVHTTQGAVLSVVTILGMSIGLLCFSFSPRLSQIFDLVDFVLVL